MTQSELYTYARRLVNANTTDWAESDLVVDMNNALSDIWVRIKVARGAMEFDDQNASTLPYYTLNLTASTQQYDVSNDGTDDLFTIHKVQVLDGSSVWRDVPRIVANDDGQGGFSTTDTARVPTGYYDMWPFLVFKEIPSTSVASGIRVWADREITYFASGGTTFVVGIPLLYHPLVAEKAALTYAISKGMNAAGNIQRLIQIGEARIDEYEGHRRKDEPRRLTIAKHDNK